MRRTKYVMVLALMLVVAGCTLNRDRLANLNAPTAELSVVPNLFCLGETVEVSWDGGPQLPGCNPGGDFDKCKYAAGGSSPAPAPWFLVSHILDYNMMGSDTAVLPHLTTYIFSYGVEWNGWATTHPETRVESGQAGRREFGRVSDSETLEPLGEGGIYYQGVSLECGPNGRWTVVDDPDLSTLDRNPDGTRAIGDGEEPPILPAESADGGLSACAGVTTFCITEIWSDEEWRLSVEGGPTVILGGEGNPICTDEFAGYHPDDIHYERADGTPLLQMEDRGVTISTQTCSPGDPPPQWGFTFFEMDVQPGTLCAVSPADGNQFSTIDSPEGFNMGTLQLRGVSLDRCLEALDPAHLAVFNNFVTMPTEIEAAIEAPATCNLEVTCGDGVCEPVCEATDCPEDCGDASTMSVDSPGLCGDGVVSGEEQCEADTDCAAGFFCGLQGSSTACTCVQLVLDGDPPPQVPGEPIASGEHCEDFPVYDCVKTEFGYSYYTGRRCYDAEGNVTFDGQVDGPFTSADWLPFCPGGGGGDGSSGGGGGGGYCGDGICQASESACGACSADCGPC